MFSTNPFNSVYRGKLAVVGEPTVGKTALIQMFCTDGSEFPKSYNMTIGAEVQSKMVPLADSEDGVQLLIYDSSGFDVYVEHLNKFWNQPDLLLIVFDVTNRKSYEFVNEWYKIATKAEWKGDNKAPIAVALFANKTDLDSRRVCTDEEAEEFAQRKNMKYFSGSAKDNVGIDGVFKYLAETFYKYLNR